MEQLSLFDNRERTAPLASRLRPDNLDDYVGQKHLIGEGKILRRLIEDDQISSMIFWGPPGVGKTCRNYNQGILCLLSEVVFVTFIYWHGLVVCACFFKAFKRDVK